MKKKFTFIFLFFSFLIGYASEENKIELYTKIGCSNCAYAKTYLNERGIQYEEHSTANASIGSAMIKRLSRSGYNGPIFMPVIFKNDTLIHPILQTDTGNIRISLQNALNIIILSRVVTLDTTNVENDEEGDCTQHYTFYIVCADFPSKSAAMRFQSILTLNGYPEAGILKRNEKYLVYAKKTGNAGLAEKEEIEIKKSYRGSYIFEELE